MKKVLVNIGEGLGNQIETIPALLYLRNKYGYDVNLINTIPTYRGADALFAMLGFPVWVRVNPTSYQMQYSTFSCAMADISIPGIPWYNNVDKSFIVEHSEVQFNLQMVDSNWSAEDCIVPSGLLSGITPINDIKVDVLIHNGFNKQKRELWEAKSYPHYRKVVNALKEAGFIVGSLGSPEEYIEGTVNLTNVPLTTTMKLLKTCKLLIANDTGTYHLAALLGVPAIAIFTFTSISKNFDPNFHRSVVIMGRTDLDCRPCQQKSPSKYWMNNKPTCNWACRDVDYHDVVEQALAMIGKL